MFIYVLDYSKGVCDLFHIRPKMSQRIDSNYVEELLKEKGYNIDEVSYMISSELHINLEEA